MIASTQMYTSGPRPHSGNNDIWATSNHGYIVRIHKRLRRARFTRFNSGCPINTDQFEDSRKTTIRRPGQEDIIMEDDYRQKERGIRTTSRKDQHDLEKHGSNQKHRHREATCPKQQHQAEYARASIRTGNNRGGEGKRCTDIETNNKTLWQTASEVRIWPTDPTDKTSDYLLDKRRTSLEEGSCCPTDILLLDYCPEMTSDGPDA